MIGSPNPQHYVDTVGLEDRAYRRGVAEGEARGARRERARIRRAQWRGLDMLIIRRNALPATDVATYDTIDRAVKLLSDATKAPKRGRRG